MQATDEITPQGAFLPSFCGVRMVFAVVVSAELLALLLALAATDRLSAFPTELSLYSLYVQWIALATCGLLCVTGGYLRRLSNVRAGLAAWIIQQLVTIVIAVLALLLLDPLTHDVPPLLFLLKSLGISAIVCALGLYHLYLQHLWRHQVEAESEARFQALQSRIRPHFLFNSMNTIANLTRSDPALAEEVVEDLADLFRASLGDAGRRSTLGDELDLVRGYLRIEQQRLGERLRLQWDLQQLPEQAPLPPLILQPLLENAIYHGIEPAVEQGSITVSGRYRRGRVNLGIRNSLPVNTRSSHHKGNRMALENTRQRLQGFFQGEASLTVGEVDGEHQVRVTFPYARDEE